MPRTLLISRENGRDLKPYGVKTVRTNMKFSFIISFGIVFLWHGIDLVESRIVNDRNYLEFLNDLDRRNVEFDDIHQQWPFSNIRRHDNANIESDSEQDDSESLTPIDDFAKIAELKAEMENRRNQKYQSLLETLISNRPEHIETEDRISSDPLQYYKEEENEESFHDYDNGYPGLEDEEEAELQREETPYLPGLPISSQSLVHAHGSTSYADDHPSFARIDEMSPVLRYDNEAYSSINQPSLREELGLENKMSMFEHENTESDYLKNKDKELIEARRMPYKPSFPRIVTELPPFIEDKSDSNEEEEVIDENPAPKPSFPPAYFPRLVAPDLPVNYKIDGIDFGLHHNKPKNEKYMFKDTPLIFKDVPLAENPSDFGIGPTDPRFYRDIFMDSKDMSAPKHNTVHPYLRKIPSSSNPKINTMEELHQEAESPSTDEFTLESINGKDVEVVPFKPDTEPDSTGVYIIAIVAGISAAATVGLIAVGIGWYKCVNGRRRSGVDGCIGE